MYLFRQWADLFSESLCPILAALALFDFRCPKSEKSAWALVVNLSRNYFIENWFSPLPWYSKAFCCKWQRFFNPAKSRKFYNSGRESCKVDLPRQYDNAVANIGYLADLIPWFHLDPLMREKNPGQIVKQHDHFTMRTLWIQGTPPKKIL